MEDLRALVLELAKTHSPAEIHTTVFDVLEANLHNTGYVLTSTDYLYKLPKVVKEYIINQKNDSQRATQYITKKYSSHTPRTTYDRELDYFFVKEYCTTHNIDFETFLRSHNLEAWSYKKGVYHEINFWEDYFCTKKQFCTKETCDGTCFT